MVSESDHFYCPGYIMVDGWSSPILCSRRAPGHKDQDLAKAVANSCNPAFVMIGQRLGAEKFYDYLENYNLIGTTGVDIPGEGSNTALVWPREDFNICLLYTSRCV